MANLGHGGGQCRCCNMQSYPGVFCSLAEGSSDWLAIVPDMIMQALSNVLCMTTACSHFADSADSHPIV